MINNQIEKQNARSIVWKLLWTNVSKEIQCMVKVYFNVQYFVCTNLICTLIFKTQHVYRCNKNNVFSAFLLYDKYICFLLTKLSIKTISGTDLLTLDLIRVMALLALAITEFPREREITSNCHCCNWRIKMQLQAQHEIKRKITFDESSIKKEFSHFTYSHGVWFMQSSDSSQVQTIVKNLCPYKKAFTFCDIRLPSEPECCFNENYHSPQPLLPISTRFVLHFVRTKTVWPSFTAV